MVWFRLKKRHLKEGDLLPPLELKDEEGNSFNTSELAGAWCVLYFYPWNNTRGCTLQAETYSGLKDAFDGYNITILGVNTAGPADLKKFKQQKKLNFRLLSDPEGQLSALLGVRIIFGMCSRDTVVINPAGKIEKILRSVSPGKSPRKILEFITSKTSA